MACFALCMVLKYEHSLPYSVPLYTVCKSFNKHCLCIAKCNCPVSLSSAENFVCRSIYIDRESLTIIVSVLSSVIVQCHCPVQRILCVGLYISIEKDKYSLSLYCPVSLSSAENLFRSHFDSVFYYIIHKEALTPFLFDAEVNVSLFAVYINNIYMEPVTSVVVNIAACNTR
ncbi:hypothetical protein ACF0H5_010812 [Mactra antiquata]